MMLVSVIIPAYNAEKWIAETVTSVLAQTYGNLEIILVDDGSTDRTVEFARQALKRGNIPFDILSQPNMGAAGARNLGWRAARGPWIQFLDADDLLEPQKIDLQVARVRAESIVDVVYTDWQMLVWSGGAWNGDDFRSPVIHNDALADILSARNFLQLGSLLFRKTILEEVGGLDQAHEPIEDVGLCVKIAIAGGTFVKAASRGPMSSYRDLPRSFSKISQRRFIESCIKNAKLAEQYVRKNPDCSPRIVETIVDVYYFGARYFAGLDWKRFDEVVTDIEALRPGFVPKLPVRINVLSRLVGYRKAERLAVFYRKGKSIGTSLGRGGAVG